MPLWDRYQRSADAPWDLKRALHLHRRVVFGACRSEVLRDLQDDPQAGVTRILNGTCRSAGTPAEFDNLAQSIGLSAVDSGSAERLKAWWLFRCLVSPRPLEERLTLMWHNHFATSNLKVNNLQLMKQQNEILRRYALSPFGDLLSAMAHDPALLQWLDAPSNRAGIPNENFARELLELFSLGIGNYSERDIKEAARALTGWTVRQGKFRSLVETHDSASKSILNQAGNWDGDDLVRIVLEEKSCARRLAWRLTNEFCGEHVVSATALNELALGLHTHQLDVRWGVETILRSSLFFSDENIQSRVADPVSFLLVPLRGMECWQTPPSTLVLAEWLSRMGQDLFYPPNVGGWAGGRAWLSSRTVIARANYATSLATGQLAYPAQRPEMPASIAAVADPVEQMRHLGDLLCGGLSTGTIQQIVEKANATKDQGNLLQQCVKEFLNRPEAQLH
jgi:uncharacterized protein (DUF1800 family)